VGDWREALTKAGKVDKDDGEGGHLNVGLDNKTANEVARRQVF
jgi:hypothetical protein